MATTIRPFSGPKYDVNSERCTGCTYPCVICGRPCPTEKVRYHIRVVDGGSRFGLPDEIVEESGDMAYFPIGPECVRKCKKLDPEFAKYLVPIAHSKTPVGGLP